MKKIKRKSDYQRALSSLVMIGIGNTVLREFENILGKEEVEKIRNSPVKGCSCGFIKEGDYTYCPKCEKIERVMPKRFKFKSNKEFYEKERKGIKNNTVRIIDIDDMRFFDLNYYMIHGFKPGEIQIEIVNNDEIDRYFVRDIVDISVYRDQMIISWNHKNAGEQLED